MNEQQTSDQVIGEGFAFFRWRVLSYPSVGDDVLWWACWSRTDFYTWRAQGKAEVQK